MRTSGKTKNTPGWPNLHRTGPGRDKHIKRGAKASSLSRARWGLFSSRLWIHVPSRLRDGFSFYLLSKMGFPGGSAVKASCLQCRRPGFDPWIRKIPWRRKRQPAPIFLPGKSHGLRSLVGYSPRGRKEWDTTE